MFIVHQCDESERRRCENTCATTGGLVWGGISGARGAQSSIKKEIFKRRRHEKTWTTTGKLFWGGFLGAAGTQSGVKKKLPSALVREQLATIGGIFRGGILGAGAQNGASAKSSSAKGAKTIAKFVGVALSLQAEAIYYELLISLPHLIVLDACKIFIEVSNY